MNDGPDPDNGEAHKRDGELSRFIRTIKNAALALVVIATVNTGSNIWHETHEVPPQPETVVFVGADGKVTRANYQVIQSAHEIGNHGRHLLLSCKQLPEKPKGMELIVALDEQILKADEIEERAWRSQLTGLEDNEIKDLRNRMAELAKKIAEICGEAPG